MGGLNRVGNRFTDWLIKEIASLIILTYFGVLIEQEIHEEFGNLTKKELRDIMNEIKKSNPTLFGSNGHLKIATFVHAVNDCIKKCKKMWVPDPITDPIPAMISKDLLKYTFFYYP